MYYQVSAYIWQTMYLVVGFGQTQIFWIPNFTFIEPRSNLPFYFTKIELNGHPAILEKTELEHVWIMTPHH